MELLKQRALTAQDTFASLRELRGSWPWLHKNLALADKVVGEIVPYTEYEQQFATHTTQLAPDDVKRNDIGNMHSICSPTSTTSPTI